MPSREEIINRRIREIEAREQKRELVNMVFRKRKWSTNYNNFTYGCFCCYRTIHEGGKAEGGCDCGPVVEWIRKIIKVNLELKCKHLQRKLMLDKVCEKVGWMIVSEDGHCEKDFVSEGGTVVNRIINYKKKSMKFSHTCEIGYIPFTYNKIRKSVRVNIRRNEGLWGRRITVTLPHIKIDIPLFIMFRSLGVESEEQIIQYILYADNHELEGLHAVDSHTLALKEKENEEKDKSIYYPLLRESMEDQNSIKIKTTELAREYLLKHTPVVIGALQNIYGRELTEQQLRITLINEILKNDFLPHLGDNNKKKIFYLALIVKNLLDVVLKGTTILLEEKQKIVM